MTVDHKKPLHFYKTYFNTDIILLSTLSTLSDLHTSTASAVETMELINPYPTAFPYGNGMVLHFYQQQERSTTKTVHKVIKQGT